MKFLNVNPLITKRDLASMLKISSSQAKLELKILRERNLIETSGRGKNTTYKKKIS